MEAVKSLVVFSAHALQRLPPPRPPPSALKLDDQVTPAFTSIIATSLAQHFPTSVLIQEQRFETKPLLLIKDKTSQATLDRRKMHPGLPEREENDTFDSDQYLKEFQSRLLCSPGLWYLFPSLHLRANTALPMNMLSSFNEATKFNDMEPQDVVALARKALSASKKAASLVESMGSNSDLSLTSSSGNSNIGEISSKTVKTIRSNRLLDRQSKKRKGPKSSTIVKEISIPSADLKRKASKISEPVDALRLFLASPETRELLTAEEESELIVQIKELARLEEVKDRLQSQLGREPTLIEWAEAVGLNCYALQSQLNRGNSSREKLVHANLRLVVHIAKKYQGGGLSFQDLLQEGSLGLMKSVQRFKPQAGPRFATYAYWWIRQSIRRAIFQHSRTIRLPDNVYNRLFKVSEAKRLCIQEGHHQPTKEQIASRAGITVEKLDKLLSAARLPLSMQQTVWDDDVTTYQEITADTAIESPEMSVEKQFMRNHIINLLGLLSPRERKIIQLRYGFQGGRPFSLSDIGAIFGLSKERVRQLESRSLYKLKQHLNSQGLDAYAEMLV